MKSLKPILICAAIILVIALAFVLFAFVFPEEQPADPSEDNSNTTPTVNAENQAIHIVDKNYEDLQSVEFMPAEGKSFRVDISLNEEGNFVYAVTPATPYFDYDHSILRSLMYTVASVNARSEITENADDLAAFGLDQPWYTVRSTFSDGEVIELRFGKKTLVDQNYYCQTNLSDKVYIIGSYTVQLLTRDELQYRDTTLFPTYEGDNIYEMIEWVRLGLRDGTIMEFDRDFEGTDEFNVIGSPYVMRSPYSGSVNDETFNKEIMTVIPAVKKIDVVCDITEDQFAEYGLDHPARLEMRDVLGNEVHLLIGNTCENTFYTYAMIEGTYTILTIETSCLSWLDIKPVELYIRLGWMYNIVDVAQMQYQFNTSRFASIYPELEASYTIELSHSTRVNNNNVTVNVVEATINGEPLDEVNCRRLFVRMLNMRIIEHLPEDADLSAEPDAVFTITTTDGKSSVMQLIPINDRDAAMVIDGKAEYFVYRKNLNNLVTGLKENALGYQLESNYSAY